MGNVGTKWNEENMLSQKSNPSEYFNNMAQYFNWTGICKVSVNPISVNISSQCFHFIPPENTGQEWVKEFTRESFEPSQPAFTCSKLTIETLEQGVKYVQS